MPKLDIDPSGLPVLLADDPKDNPFILKHRRRDLPEIITPDATSGPAEWGRYHDAVREAARSFDNPQEGDIHHFLQARARTPERVDVPAFHEAVKRQRMADLVDIVDHHMRRDGSLPRGARMVRVQAPRGYMRRALRNSTPEELAHIKHRLVSVGHDEGKVSEYLSGRVGSDIWDQADAYQIHASDTEFDGLILSDGNEAEYTIEDEIASGGFEDLLDAIKNIKPTINVFVDTKGDKQ